MGFDNNILYRDVNIAFGLSIRRQCLPINGTDFGFIDDNAVVLGLLVPFLLLGALFF